MSPENKKLKQPWWELTGKSFLKGFFVVLLSSVIAIFITKSKEIIDESWTKLAIPYDVKSEFYKIEYIGIAQRALLNFGFQKNNLTQHVLTKLSKRYSDSAISKIPEGDLARLYFTYLSELYFVLESNQYHHSSYARKIADFVFSILSMESKSKGLSRDYRYLFASGVITLYGNGSNENVLVGKQYEEFFSLVQKIKSGLRKYKNNCKDHSKNCHEIFYGLYNMLRFQDKYYFKVNSFMKEKKKYPYCERLEPFEQDLEELGGLYRSHCIKNLTSNIKKTECEEIKELFLERYTGYKQFIRNSCSYN